MEIRQPTLAQRKRQLVADELSEAALQVLAAKGFEATTIDEIVAAAGVSRRTFFRYFTSKEDVVVQLLATLGARMTAELAARPPAEQPAVALRHAIAAAVDDCAGHPEKALPVVRLILRTPALHARFLERQAQWRGDLAAALAVRSSHDPETDLYPQLAAGMALAAFDLILQRWSDSTGAEDPQTLTLQVFAMIGPALNPG